MAIFKNVLVANCGGNGMRIEGDLSGVQVDGFTGFNIGGDGILARDSELRHRKESPMTKALLTGVATAGITKIFGWS